MKKTREQGGRRGPGKDQCKLNGDRDVLVRLLLVQKDKSLRETDLDGPFEARGNISGCEKKGELWGRMREAGGEEKGKKGGEDPQRN